MLVTVNKTKFSLSKTLRTLSNILDMECAVIRLSLHHEKHLFACSHVCPLTFAIIIFSEVHAIHVFPYEISNWNKNFSCRQCFFSVSELSHTRLA